MPSCRALLDDMALKSYVKIRIDIIKNTLKKIGKHFQHNEILAGSFKLHNSSVPGLSGDRDTRNRNVQVWLLKLVLIQAS